MTNNENKKKTKMGKATTIYEYMYLSSEYCAILLYGICG